MRLHRTKKEEALYSTWARMKQRCNGSAGVEDTKNYHDRGISYSPEWEKFKSFFEDMQSTWKKGLTLDRINNNDNYSKENCRWATRKTQAINRRSTRLFTFNGEEKTLTDWSPVVGIKRSTLAQRFYGYNWSIEKTLSTP